MKQTTLELTDYASMSEGLKILLRCLDDILSSTGEKERLIMKNKDLVVQAYFKARNLIPKKMLTSDLGITEKRILQWASYKKCEVSMLKKCFVMHPRQLTIMEQDILKQYLFDPENRHLPRTYIWAKARREGLYITQRTFWRYANAFIGKVEHKVRPIEVKHEHIRARKPYSILHMDSTLVKCMNGERIWVHFVMDNYSRKILGAVPTYSTKSETVAQNLKQVIIKQNLYNKDIKLYSDDGPENHASVTELIESDKRIKIKQVFGTYKNKSNNMIEMFNYKFKYIILKKFKPKSFKYIEKTLPVMVEYYNNLYLPVLQTFTPNEVMNGRKVKFHKQPTELLRLFRMRVRENQQLDCKRLCPYVKPMYEGEDKRKGFDRKIYKRKYRLNFKKRQS